MRKQLINEDSTGIIIWEVQHRGTPRERSQERIERRVERYTKVPDRPLIRQYSPRPKIDLLGVLL